MKNYNRYDNMTQTEYDRDSWLNIVCRKLLSDPADKIIIPWLLQLSGKSILEVGAGYGRYTNRYKTNNNVDVADINPSLCENIGVPIFKASANRLTDSIKKTYDVICSFWMTEYLSPDELEQFVSEAYQLLNPNGMFCTTIMLTLGYGGLYVMGARIKGIKKYSYHIHQVKSYFHQYKHVEIKVVRSKFGLPSEVIVFAEK